MMKKLIIIAIVLVVAGAGLMAFNKFSKKQSANLVVHKDVGTVSFKAESGDYVLIEKDSQEIPNHSFVKTGSDGLAHVVLPDESMISLAENTEMQINFEDKETKVLQTLGNAWYRIKKLSGTKEFNVETPTAVASVRGTIFGVETAEVELVYVTESSVEISQLVKEGENAKRENTELLGENKLAEIGLFSTGKPEITDIPEDKRQTPWFRRNQILNRQFTDGLPADFVKKLHENQDAIQIDQELQSLRQTSVNTGNPNDLFGNFSNPNWLQQNQGCTYINTPEYTQAVAQIKTYAGVLGGSYDWVIQAINLMQSACSDNVISSQEAAQLQNHYQTMPQGGIGRPQ
jgi:hypothetical protein